MAVGISVIHGGDKKATLSTWKKRRRCSGVKVQVFVRGRLDEGEVGEVEGKTA